MSRNYQSGAQIRAAIAAKAAAERPAPIVEEPVTPEVTPEAITDEPQPAAKSKKKEN